MAAASSSNSVQRPDAKTQRYDRQLRLWASSGQTALENASILMVNGSASATQVLKNLVLPGIGSFTILDDKVTDASDVGNNFFLTTDSLGKSRAEQEVQYLKELNDSVKGNAITKSLSAFLSSSDKDDLSSYSLVLACDAPPAETTALAAQCWDQGIPFMIVRSVGFMGYARVQVNEAAFVETHPESLVDLRLDVPFPALLEYAMSLNVEAMDSMEHGHIPAVVIVVRALEEYKQSHGGSPPSNFKERKELKELINSHKRSIDDENYDEAASLIVKLAKPSKVPADVLRLFEDPACTELSPSSSSFWILLRAVKEFVEADPNHLLPLSGSLPDMKATSSGYIRLQNIYRAKAQSDLKVVTSIVERLLASLEMPTDSISPSDIQTFVKHAAYVQVIRSTSVQDELAGRVQNPKSAERLQREIEENEDSTLVWLAALRAAEAFQIQHGRWPGQDVTQYDSDGPLLEQSAKNVLSTYGLNGIELPERLGNALQELTRSSNAQLPQITALMGGIVSQEAIKIITKQYVSLDSNLIFDGIASKTSVASFGS